MYSRKNEISNLIEELGIVEEDAVSEEDCVTKEDEKCQVPMK